MQQQHDVADWGRIPGVSTTTAAEEGGACREVGSASAFVGGVSDGESGSAVHDAAVGGSDRLRVRRSIFLFTDLYVALSFFVSDTCSARYVESGVSSDVASSGGSSVWTTIAQRRLSNTGTYTSDSSGVALSPSFDGVLPPSTQWVWEGGVGVIIFPSAAAQEQQLRLSTTERTGDWADIGAQRGAVSAALFILSFEHAPPVACAAFAYAVIPNVALAAFTKAALLFDKKIILRNDASVQAVRHFNGNITRVAVTVFDASANFSAALEGWRIHFVARGAYSVSISDGTLGGINRLIMITAADPSHTGGVVHVALTREGVDDRDKHMLKRLSHRDAEMIAACGGDGIRERVVTLPLPSDGSSVTHACNLHPQ